MKHFITQTDEYAGPIIEACDFAHAEQQVEGDAVVLGELVLTITSDSMTPERANQIAKGLSETIDMP